MEEEKASKPMGEDSETEREKLRRGVGRGEAVLRRRKAVSSLSGSAKRLAVKLITAWVSRNVSSVKLTRLISSMCEYMSP